MGKKQSDLAYLIQGKEVAIVSMFSNNVQCWVKKPLKVLLSNNERMLLEGTFMACQLRTFVGKNVIITPLDGSDNIVKTNKLAGVMEVVTSLEEFDNTDNLQYGRPSHVLRRHYMTSSEEFTRFEPATHQYKRLKTGSLIL